MTRSAAILIVMLILAFPVWAQSVDPDAVTVYSDSLRIMDQSGVIRFEGNVRIELKEATLTCNELTVHTSGNDPSRVISGTAVGQVSLVRGEEKVEAGEANFDLDKGTVDLTGAPSLLKGRTRIQAERIIYSLNEGTAEFLGPVKAVFTAGEE